MTKYTLVLISALILMLFAQPVRGVPFSSAVSPTSLDAGQTSQLLNFSVSNNGSVNVTQVNITLPSGFGFAGSSGTTTSSYTFSSSPISWSNISTASLVATSGGTQYFWIYVNTPSTTGSYNFNVSVFDGNSAYNSTNVAVTIGDTIAPTYSSNTTSPSSGVTYYPNTDYWFNVTWSDGNDISKVLLEHNFTGSSTPHNETMSNSSSVYYANFTDLSAGNYVWRTYANDTSNALNSTPQVAYVIAQSSNTLRVYLNGTLNSNITSTNNTAVNITVNTSCAQPACTISITLDGSSVVSGGLNPSQYVSTITSTGVHSYNVTVAENTNYTAVTATYYVTAVPTYTTSLFNMPLTWVNETYSSINITFDSNPALQNVIIQGDWTGTATNYTMSNFSTTRYYYNTSFPAGTINWKIFGTYSGYSFNLTNSSSFTVNKYAPNLTLTISPQWTLDVPLQTNVSCTVSVTSLTAKLYRNGSLVSNPDVQTFKEGDIYIYLCNNTVAQNYTSENIQNTLFIRLKPLETLAFTQTPTLIQMSQNSTGSTEIKVKNTGGVSQSVTSTLSGIDSSWYSITNSSATILPGLVAGSGINFNIPSNAEVKDYALIYQVKGSNGTISKNFTLRVLPSDETKIKIVDSLALVKLDVSKLESRINELNSTVSNATSFQPQIDDLKLLVSQAESYISSNDYFNAYQTVEKIKARNEEIESQLNALLPISGVNIPRTVWFIIGGAAGLIIVGAIVYLAWPVKEGYKEEEGAYKERKNSLFDKIKNLFSKSKKREVEIPEGE